MCYLFNGKSYAGKMVSLYWNNLLEFEATSHPTGFWQVWQNSLQYNGVRHFLYRPCLTINFGCDFTEAEAPGCVLLKVVFQTLLTNHLKQGCMILMAPLSRDIITMHYQWSCTSFPLTNEFKLGHDWNKLLFSSVAVRLLFCIYLMKTNGNIICNNTENAMNTTNYNYLKFHIIYNHLVQSLIYFNHHIIATISHDIFSFDKYLEQTLRKPFSCLFTPVNNLHLKVNMPLYSLFLSQL